jgi:rRNA maturation endonuclease Nob1
MAGFRHGEFPMEPGLAAEAHVSDTLERTSIVASSIASLPQRRLLNEVAEELKARRRRQSAHVEAGEVRAAECCQESIEAMEQELQFLKGSQ